MKRADFITSKPIKKYKDSLGRYVFAIAYVGKDNDIVKVESFKAHLRNGEYFTVDPITKFGSTNLTRKSAHQAVDKLFDFVEDMNNDSSR